VDYNRININTCTREARSGHLAVRLLVKLTTVPCAIVLTCIQTTEVILVIMLKNFPVYNSV